LEPRTDPHHGLREIHAKLCEREAHRPDARHRRRMRLETSAQQQSFKQALRRLVGNAPERD
jgi:hypothetical protein